MSTETDLLKPREAARLLGVSYPTIKQWILSGKLRSIQTPGGHHRISESSLQPFLARDREKHTTASRERYRRISGRNQLVGKIVNLRTEGLLAQVVVAVGEQRITAVITSDAVRELQLKKGDNAVALIKSTDVMIERVDPS